MSYPVAYLDRRRQLFIGTLANAGAWPPYGGDAGLYPTLFGITQRNEVSAFAGTRAISNAGVPPRWRAEPVAASAPAA